MAYNRAVARAGLRHGFMVLKRPNIEKMVVEMVVEEVPGEEMCQAMYVHSDITWAISVFLTIAFYNRAQEHTSLGESAITSY